MSGSSTLESLGLKVGRTQPLSPAVCSPVLCCSRRASGGWLDGAVTVTVSVFVGLFALSGAAAEVYAVILGAAFSQEKVSHRRPCPGALSTLCLPRVMKGQMSLCCPTKAGQASAHTQAPQGDVRDGTGCADVWWEAVSAQCQAHGDSEHGQEGKAW